MTRLAVTTRFDDGGGHHRAGEKASIAATRGVLLLAPAPPDWLPIAIPMEARLPARSAASKSRRTRPARTEIGVSPATLRVMD